MKHDLLPLPLGAGATHSEKNEDVATHCDIDGEISTTNVAMPSAAERGRRGGLKRASRLTPEQRSAEARRAARARWDALP